MPCLDENTVAAFLGGSLAPEVFPQVERHVEDCPECRQLLAAVVRADRQGGVSHADTLPSGTAEGAAPGRGSLVGRYVVLEPIGAGGMGVVYSAYDPILERKVALKLVRGDGAPGALDEVKVRLLREGKSIAQLSHPNIVAVHDMGTFHGEVFIAMELVEGGTLKQWLREGPRSWQQVLEKFRAAGLGLSAAHRGKLVHRDFKPENVLLGTDGRVRVTDFGLVRSSDFTPLPVTLSPEPRALASPEAELVTRSGAMVGTPAYMSPEQHAGRGAEPLSDQFSFCVALWEALFGVRPYPPPGATADWRLVEPPKDSPVPPWLKRAVLRGLSLAPQERYPSMDQLLAALAADPGRVRRRRLGLAAGALFVLAATAGTAWLVSTRSERLCKGLDQPVHASWNAASQGSIRAAFAATGSGDTAAAFDLARRGLDAYWKAWASMRTEACEATRPAISPDSGGCSGHARSFGPSSFPTRSSPNSRPTRLQPSSHCPGSSWLSRRKLSRRRGCRGLSS